MYRDGDPHPAGHNPPASDAWDDDEYDDDAERPRRGLFSTLFGFVKLGLFLAPLTIFGYGYFFADCRSGANSGIGQFLNAGVCARNDVVGSAFSLQDNLRMIRRIID